MRKPNRFVTHIALGLVLTLVGWSAVAAPPGGRAAPGEADAEFMQLLLAMAEPAPRPANAGGEAQAMQTRLAILNQYFEIVNAFHAVARDPEKAAVFNLQQLEENYKAQGKSEEIVKLYEKLGKDSKSQTLRNVAHMKLSEIYKRAGRHDEAVALLHKALEANTRLLK